ncbi:MAG: RNA-binding protein [Chloroflexi bacterium]|nr:RNA-binding protein [Chloroflexota bacterium]
MNIYVGNLGTEITVDELRQEFIQFGQVTNVCILNDDDNGSGQHRTYGYVEMALKSAGEAAIINLKGKKIRDRIIDVIAALPLSNKKSGGVLRKRAYSRFNGNMGWKKPQS